MIDMINCTYPRSTIVEGMNHAKAILSHHDFGERESDLAHCEAIMATALQFAVVFEGKKIMAIKYMRGMARNANGETASLRVTKDLIDWAYAATAKARQTSVEPSPPPQKTEIEAYLDKKYPN